MNKNVTGFTIAETLVAMIISTILIAAAYTAFRTLNDQLRVISKSSSRTSDCFTLYGSVEDKFWQSDSVLLTVGDTLLFFMNDSVSAKLYCNTNGFIICQKEMIDTFKFDNPRINARTKGGITQSRFQVRSVTLSVTLDHQPFLMFFRRPGYGCLVPK